MTGARQTADRHVGSRRLTSRFDALDGAMALAAVAGGAVLVWLGFGLTFFWDEWEFIASRSLGDPASWFRPHNEHWSTVPIIVYRALVDTVGIGSYVPYHGLLIAIHVTVAVLVYALVRQTSGPRLAIVAGVIFLGFGSGFDNLFWAFQIGFAGTTAMCLAALLVVEGDPTMGRVGLLLALLVTALATSGLGLPTAVLVAVSLALRPAWRRHVWIVGVAAAAYAAWFVVVGRTGFGTQGNPASVASLLNVPRTLVQGLAGSAGALTGLGPTLGIVPAVLILAWAARRTVRGTVPVRALACLAGILSLFVLVGLARTADPLGSGDAPRYIYFSGSLLLVAVGSLIGRRKWPAHRPQRLVVAAVAGTTLALCLLWNLVLLVEGRNLLQRAADNTRALVTVELAPENRGHFDRTRSMVLTPSADVLERVVAGYGSPLRDTLVAVPPVSPEALARAEAYVLHGGPIPIP
jgi:hypothetical protein